MVLFNTWSVYSTLGASCNRSKMGFWDLLKLYMDRAYHSHFCVPVNVGVFYEGVLVVELSVGFFYKIGVVKRVRHDGSLLSWYCRYMRD